MTRRLAGAAFAWVVFAAAPASACGYLFFGTPDTILGRTVSITYDRILDQGCGGSFDPPAGLVTVKPRQGDVRVANGRFRYVAVRGAHGTDRFVITGLYKDRPYKVVVNVTFK